MTDISANNKRIAKNTLLLYFRMLLIMLVTLYTSRVVLSTLGVTDYGIYNVVGGVIVMLGFLSTSLGGASSRFITFELGKHDKDKLKTTFANLLTIHSLMALLVVILGETLGLWFVSTQLQIPTDREIAALWVFQCSVLSSSMAIFYVPYHALIIAHEKMAAFAYISIIDAIFKLGIVYVVVMIPFDKLIVYAIFMFIVQVIVLSAYIIYSVKHFEESHTFFKYNPQIFKEIFSFAGWTLNGHLAYLGYTQGLNILLNIFFNPAVNAARAIAVQIQHACQQFCGNFLTAVRPQLIKRYAQGEFLEMQKLLIQSSKFAFFIIFIIALPIMLEAEFIIELWLGDVPEHTVTFLRLILISSMLYALANPILTSVHATGNLKKFQLIEGSMLLSIIPISYFLLKFYNMPPATVFVVHIVVEICTQIARVKIVLPMINMTVRNYVVGVLKPILLIGGLAPVIPFCVFYNLGNGWASFLGVCFVSFITSIIIIFILGCSVSEKHFIISQLKNASLKLSKHHK